MADHSITTECMALTTWIPGTVVASILNPGVVAPPYPQVTGGIRPPGTHPWPTFSGSSWSGNRRPATTATSQGHCGYCCGSRLRDGCLGCGENTHCHGGYPERKTNQTKGPLHETMLVLGRVLPDLVASRFGHVMSVDRKLRSVQSKMFLLIGVFFFCMPFCCPMAEPPSRGRVSISPRVRPLAPLWCHFC